MQSAETTVDQESGKRPKKVLTELLADHWSEGLD